MILFNETALVCAFVAERGGGKEHPEVCSALGWVNSEKKLTAGLVFHHATTRSICVDIALEGVFFPKTLLTAGLRYVFGQLALQRLTFFIADTNIRSCALVEDLGAVREATLQDACSDGALRIYALRPENCKIWSQLNVQGRRSATIS